MCKPSIQRMPDVTEAMVECAMQQARRERAIAFGRAMWTIRKSMCWRRDTCQTAAVAKGEAP